MLPINEITSTMKLNWCYAACALGCGVSAGACLSICTVDGPLPIADAAGAKVSLALGASGSGGAGMICDNAIN